MESIRQNSKVNVLRLSLLIISSIIVLIMSFFISVRYIPAIFHDSNWELVFKDGLDSFICMAVMIFGVIIAWFKYYVGGAILVINSLFFITYWLLIKSDKFPLIYDTLSIMLGIILMTGLYLIYNEYKTRKSKINI